MLYQIYLVDFSHYGLRVMGLLSFRFDNFVLDPSPEYHTYDSYLAQNNSQKAEPPKKNKNCIC
jgi:hypothetical protein